jgi:hypothetical protein
VPLAGLKHIEAATTTDVHEWNIGSARVRFGLRRRVRAVDDNGIGAYTLQQAVRIPVTCRQAPDLGPDA